MKKKFTLNKNEQKLALLIDPDWARNKDWLIEIFNELKHADFDLILIGGSLVNEPDLITELIKAIKKLSALPVYLFPGHAIQLNKEADGILFISLISGRNPEFLIGQHVISAPLIKSYNLDVIPTGYMIVGDSMTSAHYMSQTHAIPYFKTDIAIATALAGEMLGLKFIYIDGGSGADRSPSLAILKGVSDEIEIPLIVGGGIQNRKQVDDAFKNGANLVVIGSAAERDPSIIAKMKTEYANNN